MDQVDRIIILSLKKLGLPVDEENVSGIQDLDSDFVIRAVIACLVTIEPDYQDKFPHTLPPSMSLKFRICSEIAEAIKSIGFKSDLGYQSLLYPNETELRRLFMFLVESLPKEASDSSASVGADLDARALLLRQIVIEIQKRLDQTWKPHYLRRSCVSQSSYRNGIKGCLPFSTAPDLNFKQSCPELPPTWLSEHSRMRAREAAAAESRIEKATPEQYQAKLEEIEKAQKERIAAELLARARARAEIQVFVDDTEVGDEERAKQLKELQDRLDEISAQLGEAVRKTESCVGKTKALTTRIEQIKEECVEKEALFKTLKKTYDLLPNADDSIIALEKFLDSAEDRMNNLKTQLAAAKEPLVAQRDQLEHQVSTQLSLAQKVENEIKENESRLLQLGAQHKEKEKAIKVLSEEVSKLSADRARNVFTAKIMDIIGQIHKQKQGIEKIRMENRDLQRDISSLSGKLDRAFTVTDELIFKDASRDETARRSYKLLASIHENCQLLLRGIEDTGSLSREIRELENQIDLESKKKTVLNLQKIQNDLKEMKNDNAKLKASVASLKPGGDPLS